MNTFAMNSLQAQANNPLILRGAFQQIFNKAAAHAKRRRFLAKFNGRSTQLKSLKSINTNENQLPGIRNIALGDIVGSEGRCQDFDNQFRPLQNHHRDRWVNIALARYKQQTLPPVQLVHTSAGYFVRDGHHRISVARAMGQAMIEAEVI